MEVSQCNQQISNDYSSNNENMIGFLVDVTDLINHDNEEKEQKDEFQHQENSNEQNGPANQSFINILKNIIEDDDKKKKEQFYSFTYNNKSEKQIDDLVSLIEEYKDIKEQVNRKLQVMFEQWENDQQTQKDFYIDILKWISQNGVSNVGEYYKQKYEKTDNKEQYPTVLSIASKIQSASLISFVEQLPKSVNLFSLDDKPVSTNSNYSQEIGYLVAIIIKGGVSLLIFHLDSKDKAEESAQECKEMCQSLKVKIEKIKELIEKDDLESAVKANIITLNKLRFNKITSQKRSESNKVGDEKNQEDLLDTMNSALQPILYTPFHDNCKQAFEELLKELVYFCFSKKTLVIISDGKTMDEKTLDLLKQIKSTGVVIVVCQITESELINNKQLYTFEQSGWSDETKTLFNLSSVQSNFQQPLCFLQEETSFKLSTFGSSHLFILSNNPSEVKEFVSYTIRVKDHTDALADLLGDESLEPYLKIKSEFQAKRQVGKTCSANSIAAVYHMAMKRIFRRKGGYPSFETIRDSLLDAYGRNGGVQSLMISQTCRQYRLKCQFVDIQTAKLALSCGRPIAARFEHCAQQIKNFEQFFKENPSGILESVGPCTIKPNDGHAVVLVGYGDNYLRFLNSWGSQWGDEGYFRIKDENALSSLQFIDIYWTLDDLLEIEKSEYENNTTKFLSDYSQQLNDIFESIQYTCSLCSKNLLFKYFNESNDRAICQECQQNTDPIPLNEILTCQIEDKTMADQITE